MKNEILITDLFEAAVEKERISEEISKSKWRVLDYETSFCKGRLLCVSHLCSPPKITLKLPAKGKYDLYLGMLQPKGAPAAISLRLSDSEEISHIKPLTVYDWTPLETMVESYFKTVELNGQSLILAKPSDYIEQSCALAWIRLVPSEEQKSKQKSIAYHLDSDYFSDDAYPSCDSVSGRIGLLEDGGAELILQEVLLPRGNDPYNPDKELYPRAAGFKYYHDNKIGIEKSLINKAHSMGAKIFAAYRLQAAEFAPPNDFSGINLFFNDSFEALSDFRCYSRDGRQLAMCSYAYEEVRKNAVSKLLTLLESGFDGVSLIFCRGTFIGFEKPVLDEIYRRFGIDGRRLPMSDPRYWQVACSFITEFMRELRAALDEKFTSKKEINAVVLFTPENSKANGFDVEGWINEGLVDSVSQGLMRVYEDLEGCLGDDGLIDLGKYENQLLKRRIIKRDFRINEKTTEMLLCGAKDFLKICNTNTDFYATLLWEAQSEEETVAVTDKLKAIGIKRFISWNANHKAKILSRINAEKYYAAGSAEEYEKKRSKYYRTLTIGGNDISHFDPNWKG